jgi:hypothetical protein
MKLFGAAIVLGGIGSVFTTGSETVLLVLWGVALLTLARTVRGRTVESIR